MHLFPTQYCCLVTAKTYVLGLLGEFLHACVLLSQEVTVMLGSKVIKPTCEDNEGLIAKARLVHLHL